ncbi:MAG TPA: hypothetical protein VGH19_04135 [Verrucomicrobiae bacterium]
MNTIHINWDGPFTLKDVTSLNKPHDYGVYQVYGPNPTHGRVELLYIGLAHKVTFSVRIPKHTDWISYTRDSSQASIYIGRLSGIETPENMIWERQIVLAERLLIHAHYPTYNRQKDSVTCAPEFPNLHIFNWGRHRDLLPEVSGARFGKMPDIKFYGSHPSVKESGQNTVFSNQPS